MELTVPWLRKLRRTVAITIVVDVDVTVWSLCDVGVGDGVALIEEQFARPGFAVIGGEKGSQIVSPFPPVPLFGGVFSLSINGNAMPDEQDIARLEPAEHGLTVDVWKEGRLRLPGLATIGGKTLKSLFHSARKHPKACRPAFQRLSAR